ncbi:MAG: hypothetical protein MI976_27530 [Pseudomonadales bacterium]|nr:hypothetical protein [Pseudomonadales bacterium]
MKKIAVFGKPGSGKSTLSKKLAAATGIPLHPLDSIIYTANGEQVDRSTFDSKHEAILSSDCWIIDGFGPVTSFFNRLDRADTLIYIDLPYPISYWLVTKRMLKGLFVTPEGWPKGSSVIKGSMESYRFLKLSPAFWNETFVKKLEEISKLKTLYTVRSISELNGFVAAHVE